MAGVLFLTLLPCGSHGEEATPKVCGVGVAMLPGQSRVPHWLIDCWVNVGTISRLPVAGLPARAGGRFVAG
jgi:hypothetical protein